FVGGDVRKRNAQRVIDAGRSAGQNIDELLGARRRRRSQDGNNRQGGGDTRSDHCVIRSVVGLILSFCLLGQGLPTPYSATVVRCKRGKRPNLRHLIGIGGRV